METKPFGGAHVESLYPSPWNQTHWLGHLYVFGRFKKINTHLQNNNENYYHFPGEHRCSNRQAGSSWKSSFKAQQDNIVKKATTEATLTQPAIKEWTITADKAMSTRSFLPWLECIRHRSYKRLHNVRWHCTPWAKVNQPWGMLTCITQIAKITSEVSVGWGEMRDEVAERNYIESFVWFFFVFINSFYLLLTCKQHTGSLR